MESHLRAIGIIHIILNSLHILCLLMVPLLITLIPLPDNFYFPGESWVFLFIAVILFFIFIFSILGIIGGIALLKRKKWSKVLVLVASAAAALSFPFGTALAVYSFWAILNEKSPSYFTADSTSV